MPMYPGMVDYKIWWQEPKEGRSMKDNSGVIVMEVGGFTPKTEPGAKKQNRHVVIALRHMTARRAALLEKRAELTMEIEELDAAILALE
jgi:hypothetical protein